MPIFKDIKNRVKSRVARYRADSAFTNFATKKLQPTQMGRESYDKAHGVIRDFVKQGKHKEALEYSRSQQQKVQGEVDAEKRRKRVPRY